MFYCYFLSKLRQFLVLISDIVIINKYYFPHKQKYFGSLNNFKTVK